MSEKLKLSKEDKKSIKMFLRIAKQDECKKEMCMRSIAHILDRARNPERYSDSR